jgi:transposase-like protein
LRHAVGMNASSPTEGKSQAADAKSRHWSDEERDLIVRASLKKGTTVNAVARLYGVQPGQVYDWRKKARQAATQSKAATLIPVHVTEPQADKEDAKQSCRVLIEAQSTRITITGLIDAIVVRTILECVTR